MGGSEQARFVMFQLVLLLLQVTRQVLAYMERSRLIQEGERKQIAREMARVAQAGALAKEIRSEVEKLSDDEVDAALRGDYRD